MSMWCSAGPSICLPESYSWALFLVPLPGPLLAPSCRLRGHLCRSRGLRVPRPSVVSSRPGHSRSRLLGHSPAPGACTLNAHPRRRTFPVRSCHVPASPQLQQVSLARPSHGRGYLIQEPPASGAPSLWHLQLKGLVLVISRLPRGPPSRSSPLGGALPFCGRAHMLVLFFWWHCLLISSSDFVRVCFPAASCVCVCVCALLSLCDAHIFPSLSYLLSLI